MLRKCKNCMIYYPSQGNICGRTNEPRTPEDYCSRPVSALYVCQKCGFVSITPIIELRESIPTLICNQCGNPLLPQTAENINWERLTNE